MVCGIKQIIVIKFNNFRKKLYLIKEAVCMQGTIGGVFDA